jgi:hypothetical protein
MKIISWEGVEGTCCIAMIRSQESAEMLKARAKEKRANEREDFVFNERARVARLMRVC